MIRIDFYHTEIKATDTQLYTFFLKEIGNARSLHLWLSLSGPFGPLQGYLRYRLFCTNVRLVFWHVHVHQPLHHQVIRSAKTCCSRSQPRAAGGEGGSPSSRPGSTGHHVQQCRQLPPLRCRNCPRAGNILTSITRIFTTQKLTTISFLLQDLSTN